MTVDHFDLNGTRDFLEIFETKQGLCFWLEKLPYIVFEPFLPFETHGFLLWHFQLLPPAVGSL